jgi:Flp pilus assembly protein CpaB
MAAGSRNNFIPLILAVVLAIGAVFLVQRQLNQKEMTSVVEEKVDLVITTRDLKEKDIIKKEDCKANPVPRSAVPPRAVLWSQLDMVLNQELVRPLPEGSYIQLGDVNVGGGLSELVANNKWAISVSLNGGAISRRLRPNDHIAIVGSFDVTEEIKKVGPINQTAPAAAPIIRKRKVTTVILPDVRILALDGTRQQGGDEFILELPPQEAQVLLAAQAKGIELSPALRKTGDDSNRDRVAVKLVDDETFNKLVKDVETITVPATPAN